MENYFNEKLNDFLGELEEKENAIQNKEIYINQTEKKEREQQAKRESEVFEFNEEFKDKIEEIQNIVEHTKFKGRFKCRFDTELEEVIFYLDNKAVFQLNYEEFDEMYYSDNQQYEKEIIKQLYTWENAYTLIDFVENQCFISTESKLPHKARISVNEFIREYVSYTENKFGADKVMNLKRIVRVLNYKYNCKKIKYHNSVQLDRITTLDIYNNQTENSSCYDKTNKIIFFNFIKNFCVVSDFIDPSQRIKRSDFYKVYKAYLNENNYNDYKLNNEQIKVILKEEYKEVFIKSNGIFYMRKIKFKKF